VVDIGCGLGETGWRLRTDQPIESYEDFYMIGIDCFAPYIKRLRSFGNIYDELREGMVPPIDLKDDASCVTLCGNMIEHLERADGIELLKEKAFRFDTRTEDHKCSPILQFLITHVPPDLPSNNGTITMPRMAMPDKYKCQDPVLSYRVYYLNDKQSMLVWRKRSPPPWVPKSLHHIHYNSEISRYTKILNKMKKRKTKTQDHLDQIDLLQATIADLQSQLSNL